MCVILKRSLIADLAIPLPLYLCLSGHNRPCVRCCHIDDDDDHSPWHNAKPTWPCQCCQPMLRVPTFHNWYNWSMPMTDICLADQRNPQPIWRIDDDVINRVQGHPQWKMTKKATLFTDQETSCKIDVCEYRLI